MLRQGNRNFLLAGDVYRRDEIDSSHYPVFHQMEGMRMFGPGEIPGLELLEEGERTEEKQEKHTLLAAQYAEADLKKSE
ncbi:phenylalanyl-tRNA synthetase [Sphaeroforma arctica JP610]|uniref:Phenylalanyl-tRNA synthetase n=1 Tax=Sphaeroforma arctica JP610 TaxID=667725 RepID=A0A0L0F5A0_9EUKA|nr:phenylalanyl-tRNA synthetase [Sphaeroforma arctica JP610]KNC71892.1 phenylalanyl-tRNA synthetase [Sphaeroforma arctica JP610]|eukprot:XP_014145794.1 phenylalanyl-tRNA synthetase [Sphaeroforma arctica JP610]